MASPNARRGLTVAGVLLLALGAVTAQNAALARRAQFPAGEDVLYLPRPPALKALLLGHGELAADLVFIRALVYFGTQFQQKGEYRWLENYLDTITALDPRWKTPYVWAGVATMYNGKTIDNHAVEMSSRFLERGARQFPDDWQLPFMLACNYLFELHSDDAQQKEEWRRIGGEWIRHAADVGGAPSWVPLLSATIMRQEGRDEAAVHHLEEVYLSTQDERARQDIRNQLGALHSRLDLVREARERRAFELAWRRTLPYASQDLFVAVGAPRPPRMDWQALSPLAPVADDATNSVAPPATNSVAP
jgi:hypothetical protein